tara:strand:+ start:177 stop:437 length:261 start_codon:yes stop_codon:yes gene_type:complete
MISGFSDSGYLNLGLPHPRSCFFGKPIFQHLVGQLFLEITRFRTQRLHLVTRGLACGIDGEALFASFRELLRPAVIKALGEALTAA